MSLSTLSFFACQKSRHSIISQQYPSNSRSNRLLPGKDNLKSYKFWENIILGRGLYFYNGMMQSWGWMLYCSVWGWGERELGCERKNCGAEEERLGERTNQVWSNAPEFYLMPLNFMELLGLRQIAHFIWPWKMDSNADKKESSQILFGKWLVINKFPWNKKCFIWTTMSWAAAYILNEQYVSFSYIFRSK